METQSIEIASTILHQIKSLDYSALMAWGARNFLALPETDDCLGGIRFNVNGLKHNGLVKIMLTYADDYSIYFLSSNGEIVHQVEGVYCDMLVEVLDWVEGK